MSIREEFEKAIEDTFHQAEGFDKPSTHGVALWAAKWMAERCAKIIKDSQDEFGEYPLFLYDDIRQLAKELETPK